jgi:hypothetical protein
MDKVAERKTKRASLLACKVFSCVCATAIICAHAVDIGSGVRAQRWEINFAHHFYSFIAPAQRAQLLRDSLCVFASLTLLLKGSGFLKKGRHLAQHDIKAFTSVLYDNAELVSERKSFVRFQAECAVLL